MNSLTFNKSSENKKVNRNKPVKVSKFPADTELCPYEKLRQDNIDEKMAYLKELGFPPPCDKNVIKPKKTQMCKTSNKLIVLRRSKRIVEQNVDE